MSRSATACRLFSHVHVTGHTTIGPRTTIYPFASLGTPPQSVKYRGGPTKLIIGADCEIRESVTMNTGTEDAGGVTAVGDKCLFMVGTHVGHDCIVGNNVTMANNALLGGHCHGRGLRDFRRPFRRASVRAHRRGRHDRRHDRNRRRRHPVRICDRSARHARRPQRRRHCAAAAIRASTSSGCGRPIAACS